jgi:hypothetical protein
MTLRLRPLLLAALVAAAVFAGSLRAQSFVAEYPPVQGSEAIRQREWLMETGNVERLAGWLNRWIRMPRRVALRMVECPSSDIRWNRQEHAVEMCYRMITRLYGIAAEDDSLRRAAGGAQLFVTMHGVAHAIIGELGLPVGADPEVAVDELSALLLTAVPHHETPAWVVGGVTALQAADAGWANHGAPAGARALPERGVPGVRHRSRGVRVAPHQRTGASGRAAAVPRRRPAQRGRVEPPHRPVPAMIPRPR